MVHLQIAFRQESSITIDPERNEYKYYCIAVGAVTLEVAIDSGEQVELIDVNTAGANDEGGQNGGGTDDADEPGDIDVNDKKRTQTLETKMREKQMTRKK